MTAQISDTVIYMGEPYDLVGVHAKGLFDPAEHDIKTFDTCCSACWRGVLCEYTIKDDEIRLTSLRTLQKESAKELFGVKPDYDKKKLGLIFTAGYFNLQKKIAVTGGILIARDFIEKLYVHMGFHPAWKYREVHEFIFNNGEIQQAHDRSKEIAAFREDMKDAPLKPKTYDRGEIEKWIRQCFSLDYKW